MAHFTIFALIAGMIVAFGVATLGAEALAGLGFPLPKGSRFAAIDGLRGYLALSVMAHHFIIWTQLTQAGMGWVAPIVPFFNQLGAGAVALFFMTTGFLFYPNVQAGWRAVPWRGFLVKRLFRIEPVVVVSILLVLLVVGLRQGVLPGRADLRPLVDWLTNGDEPGLMGEPNAGQVNGFVLWSLYFEWIFYLIILPLCAVARDLSRAWLPCWTIPAALVLLGVVRMALGIEGGIGGIFFLPLFGIGMLAHEVVGRPAMVKWLNRGDMACLAVVALLAVMVMFPVPYQWALPGFAFFFAVVAAGNTFGPLLRTKGAQVLGACSFGIYTTHGIMLSILFTEGAHLTAGLSEATLPILLPLVALVVLAFAALLHVGVEMPGIAAGKRLARVVQGRPAPRRAPITQSTPQL